MNVHPALSCVDACPVADTFDLKTIASERKENSIKDMLRLL